MDLLKTTSTSGKTGLSPLIKVGPIVDITPKLSSILDIVHTIKVHLIELAMNIDPDNDRHKWTVLKKKQIDRLFWAISSHVASLDLANLKMDLDELKLE